MKRLGVLQLPPLDGMLVHRKVPPPAFRQASLTIHQYLFTLLGGERNGESKVLCPRTNTLTQLSLKPRTLDAKSSALAIMPLRLAYLHNWPEKNTSLTNVTVYSLWFIFDDGLWWQFWEQKNTLNHWKTDLQLTLTDLHQKLPKCIQIHLTATSFFNCKTFYISVKFLLSITYVPLRGLGLSLPPDPIITPSEADKYPLLVHTTQVNSAFSTHWLASSKVNSKYQFYSPLSSWRDKSMQRESNFEIQAKHKKLV